MLLGFYHIKCVSFGIAHIFAIFQKANREFHTFHPPILLSIFIDNINNTKALMLKLRRLTHGRSYFMNTAYMDPVCTWHFLYIFRKLQYSHNLHNLHNIRHLKLHFPALCFGKLWLLSIPRSILCTLYITLKTSSEWTLVSLQLWINCIENILRNCICHSKSVSVVSPTVVPFETDVITWHKLLDILAVQLDAFDFFALQQLKIEYVHRYFHVWHGLGEKKESHITNALAFYTGIVKEKVFWAPWLWFLRHSICSGIIWT